MPYSCAKISLSEVFWATKDKWCSIEWQFQVTFLQLALSISLMNPCVINWQVNALLTADVDASGKLISFVEMSGEALKFHKPGNMLPLHCLHCENISFPDLILVLSYFHFCCCCPSLLQQLPVLLSTVSTTRGCQHNIT